MRHKVVISAVLAGVAILMCCAGGTMALLLGGLNPDPNDPRLSYAACGADSDINLHNLPELAELTQEQMRNAAVIVQIGQEMRVPPRGWVVAIGTAAQESNLHNLGHLGDRNDHDSLGLF
ncbi:MAG: M23 family peptidase, partial [Longispora sp.]|nr:M23 family peptidase [Longispora sp. (in: high G+C Gram-positive bacteria)]